MIGAAGEIRTPEVRHHRISNPAQWPGYATAACNWATYELHMNMTVANAGQKRRVSLQWAEETKPFLGDEND